jgi:hypothetical protein
VDLRTPLIEELYVPSASQARIDRVLKLFDPVLNTALKSMIGSDRIKTQFMNCILTAFVEALEFILLYGGTNRNFELDDAEIFVEDVSITTVLHLDNYSKILILRDAFTGKRKSSAERPPLTPQVVNEQTEHLKKLATNILALQTDYLIKQYESSPVLESDDQQSPITSFTKWNILSILIHRNDKEARKFVRALKDAPLYIYLKKGAKKELAEALASHALTPDTASKPTVTSLPTPTSTLDKYLAKLENNLKNI